MEAGGAHEVSAGPAVVFCGGCNPQIDRGAVAEQLRLEAGAAGGGRIRADAAVQLSGCPRACASEHELRVDDPGAVVVAGELVDGRPTNKADIAATIARKLKE